VKVAAGMSSTMADKSASQIFQPHERVSVNLPPAEKVTVENVTLESVNKH